MIIFITNTNKKFLINVNLKTSTIIQTMIPHVNSLTQYISERLAVP